MILGAFIHLAATFFGKAYRRPREVTWLTGVALLFITLTFGFTGYLLPWNTLAYFATKVGTEIAGDVQRAILSALRPSRLLRLGATTGRGSRPGHIRPLGPR